ncbi:putative RNA-directed DNA polymerase [Tanacetum coccineum]
MPPFLPLRRSTRDHHPSTSIMQHEVCLLTDGGEPECYAEAMKDEHKKEWFEAMEDEMNSLRENNTVELVKLPKSKRALKNKWLQIKIFSPVVKMGSIRVVLGLATSLDLEVEQMDVKTAFLHSDLDKEIYMEQPKGFQIKGKEGYVCRLQKSMYGLKQAPRQWYKKFESVIGKQAYRKTSSNHCVFFQKFGDDDFIILLLYVDDMLIVGKNIGRIAQLKRDLSKSFSMKNLGPAKQIIGIRIFRDTGAKKLHIFTMKQYLRSRLRYAGNKDNMKFHFWIIDDLSEGACFMQSRLTKVFGIVYKEVSIWKLRKLDAIEVVMFELNNSSIRNDNASRYVDKCCRKRKVEGVLLDRRDGELILIGRKGGDLLVRCVKSCEEKKRKEKKEVFRSNISPKSICSVFPITGDCTGIINQLAGMGIKFEDEIQGLWLLGTLPDTWETFRTSLSNSAPDGVITMELAKGSILNEETRRKSQGSSSQSDVLVTERRGRSQSRGPSNRGNHRSSSSKGKFADLKKKRTKKKKNYNNQKNKHKKDDDGDDNTKVNTTTDEFFVCYDYDMVNLANDDSSWILDSGATCHVFSDDDGYHNSSGNGLWKVTLGSLYCGIEGKRKAKTRLAFRFVLLLEWRTYLIVLHSMFVVLDEVLNTWWGFGAAKMFHTVIYEFLDARHLCIFHKDEKIKSLSNGKPCVFLGVLMMVDAHEQTNLDEEVHPELPVPDMPPFLPLRRSTRDHHSSIRYSAHKYVLLTDGGEPECYAEAMEDKHQKEWFKAMEDEMNSLHENNTFEEIGHWILMRIFSLVVKWDQFELFLALAAASDLEKNIEKMDRVPYASAVGSLMYDMVCTRPDLAHAVGVVSRFLSNPGKKHWEAVKWIFRYLRGTSKLGITFINGKLMLVGFTDLDMARNKDNMKSTSRYLMTFTGGAVSWQSRLQKCMALSTTEAEYMAATEACKELLWLKRFLQELGFKQQRYAVLCDNQSAIHLAKNSMFHKRTKHIDIRYHWIRDAIRDAHED